MKISECISVAVSTDPQPAKWAGIASGLAEAMIERALSMPVDELMAFIADTEAGKRLAHASEKEIASAACIVRTALL